MNRFIYTLCLLTLTLSFSCTNEEQDNRLPILGYREPVTKTVDGKEVTDTAYHTIADFDLTDQYGRQVTPQDVQDKIYVADFFFTSCPTICPVMKTQMLRVYEKYKDNEEVLILSHSIDPDYDTVELLHDYAERLGVEGDTWRFLTGDRDTIMNLGQVSYMVSANEDKDAPGGRVHSGAFILIDKDRRIRGYYDGTREEEVTELLNDMDRLLAEYHENE